MTETEQMIELKSPSQIDLMRRAGDIVGETLESLRLFARAGRTSLDLDALAFEILTKRGSKTAFKGYRGYPAHLCVSVNQEVVHGIPSKRVLKDGDIVGVDFGVIVEGYYADAALTLLIGDVSQQARDLVLVTEQALAAGIAHARVGNRLSDISHAIQSHVEAKNYSVVREFVGHGIGTQLHEQPQIPNYGKPGFGPELKEGMVLAIEPMVNSGLPDVEILEDGWTAVTKDGSLSAHFEHTVVVKDGEPEILTLWQKKKQSK